MQPQDSAEPYEGSELFKLRHTAAHVMAQAVLDLFPGAKLGIGPPVTDGFYYDFDLGVDDNWPPAHLRPGRSAAHREAHAPDHRRQAPAALQGRVGR